MLNSKQFRSCTAATGDRSDLYTGQTFVEHFDLIANAFYYISRNYFFTLSGDYNSGIFFKRLQYHGFADISIRDGYRPIKIRVRHWGISGR